MGEVSMCILELETKRNPLEIYFTFECSQRDLSYLLIFQISLFTIFKDLIEIQSLYLNLFHSPKSWKMCQINKAIKISATCRTNTKAQMLSTRKNRNINLRCKFFIKWEATKKNRNEKCGKDCVLRIKICFQFFIKQSKTFL